MAFNTCGKCKCLTFVKKIIIFRKDNKIIKYVHHTAVCKGKMLELTIEHYALLKI